MTVVDASLVVEFLAPDASGTGAARELFERWASARERLHGPTLLVSEVRNALLTGVRRGRWEGSDADAACRLAELLPVTVHDDPRDRQQAWELSRRYDNHPIYDMVYVALAQRLDEPLVTLDERLRARLAHLGRVRTPDEVL